jgi:membrane-associated protein
MTLDQYILQSLVQYGLPVLVAVILFASTGLPLPATLLLLTAGSFVEQGDLNLWWVLGLTTAAAVLGDHVGYGIGRWGGERLIRRFQRWGGGAERMAQAERLSRRWGGIGIFLSRWLISPLGPVINLTSGMTRYPLILFLCFDLLGEIVWVTLYVTLGRMFSDQVQTLSSTLGNFTWVIVGVLLMIVLGRFLFRPSRPAVAAEQASVHQHSS